MSDAYMDKLISDIQQYLRGEERKEKKRRLLLLTAAGDEPKRQVTRRRPMIVALIAFLAACAMGSITVAIILLAVVSGPAHDSVKPIWMLGLAGCGIFFSVMLVSVWKRLVILKNIEENTRLILAARHKTNALLEQFIESMP